jgi:hypothetical protein
MAVAAPNFQKLLAGDTQLRSTLTDLQAQKTGLDANLQAQRSSQLAQYGGIPSNFGNLAGSVNVDETTRGLANAATQSGVSTLAQLAHAYQKQQSASAGDVAARGIGRSGAYGQHATENLHNYNIAQYQAQQQLLDTLNSLWSNYQQNTQGLVNQGATANTEALQRIIEQINAGVLGGGQGGAPVAAQPQMPGMSSGGFRGIL